MVRPSIAERRFLLFCRVRRGIPAAQTVDEVGTVVTAIATHRHAAVAPGTGSGATAVGARLASSLRLLSEPSAYDRERRGVCNRLLEELVEASLAISSTARLLARLAPF